MNDKKAFIVYRNWEKLMIGFSDEEVGRITRALFRYSDNKEIVIEENDKTYPIYLYLIDVLDIDENKYKERCEQNRMIALERWEMQRKKDSLEVEGKEELSGLKGII